MFTLYHPFISQEVDSYGNKSKSLARPLPVEFLLVDVSIGNSECYAYDTHMICSVTHTCCACDTHMTCIHMCHPHDEHVVLTWCACDKLMTTS